MNVFLKQLKEVSLSVFSITLLVVILNFTCAPIETEAFIRFIIGAIIVCIGLGIFLFGANIGITPIGTLMGKTVALTNKARLVGSIGFILGFLITIAEPDLQILAQQVYLSSGKIIPNLLFLVVVSTGVGIMVAVGLLRIVYEKRLNRIFLLIYFIIFILGLKASEEFLAIAVDASGATTGAMSTPFILALGYGVSQLKGGKKTEEDSFGMVGLASTGPIFAVMLMSIIKNLANLKGVPSPLPIPNMGIWRPFLEILPLYLKESVIILIPLTLVFLVFNKIKFKLNKRSKLVILKGLLYTFIGLTLFMVGVNAGFMEVGRVIGKGIAHLNPWLLPIIGFLLGTVVVLAEPAVYVLTNQVEEVTAGHIKKKAILIALSIGIAFAISASMLRIIIPTLKLWHFLLPGFGLATILSFRVSPVFVGIAYDAGGVASGPMTATFVLAFAQGAAGGIPSADILADGFGIIAMVAMMPLIAIQVLGVIFKIKSRREEMQGAI